MNRQELKIEGRPATVNREQVAALCALHGLGGWKGYTAAHPTLPGRYIAVVHSPDYRPAAPVITIEGVRSKPPGSMIARTGRDPADALAIAIEAAGGKDPELAQ